MKKNLFKRLALITVLFLSATIASAHDFEVDGIFYNKNEDDTTVSVTYKGDSGSSYDEYSGSVTIPASVTYSGKTYSVTSIGKRAFRGCCGLTAVEIPNSVTTIGSCAFSCCNNLQMVIYNAKNCSGPSSFNVFDSDKEITFVLGDEVERIGDNILQTRYSNHTNYTKKIVSHSANPPKIENNTFATTSCPLYVPKGAYTRYWIAYMWGKFSNT